MPSREELIKLIEDIDEYLGKSKVFFDTLKVEDINNIEYIDKIASLSVSTIDLISVRHKLKKLLLDEYGIMVMTKN